MSFVLTKKLPTPMEIKELYPVSEELAALKAEKDQELIDIITGASDKFMVIIGPCSADNEEAVCDYIGRLTKVQEKVKDKLVLVPRIYTNKPRTTGEGYKGMLHQPDPEKAPDLLNGLIAIRKIHMHALQTFHMPIADEMLYPENFRYLSDILSYVAVGARSVENQQHRLVASGIEVPTGMKNPTSGDFSVMLNSVYAAQHPHHFIYRGCDVETSGNDLAHTILRGGVNQYGQTIPNYHYEDLMGYMLICEPELTPEELVHLKEDKKTVKVIKKLKVRMKIKGVGIKDLVVLASPVRSSTYAFRKSYQVAMDILKELNAIKEA